MPSTTNVLPDEIRRAKWPHEIFLINLVFNHILVFASTFGVYSTFPLMVLVVPVTSAIITGYIFFGARRIASSGETPLVKAHWAVADKRNKHFMALLAIACILGVVGFGLATLAGWSKLTMIAVLGGVGLLPFMVSLLVLIVMGNFSMYEARHNKLPKGYEAAATPGASGGA
jgi:hypothetical protein